MAETSLKRFKMMAEEDKKREKRYMAFRRAEAEKNWEHELRIAEIFARAAQSTSPPNFGFSRSVTLPLQQGSDIPNQTARPTSPDNHDPYQSYF